MIKKKNFRQLGQAGVRHGYHAGVRLDGADGEVFRADAGFCQCVEQGGFAYVGKANEAAVKSHGMPLLELKNLGGLYRCIGKGASKFFFSSRRRHTRSLRDWSSDVCSSD